MKSLSYKELEEELKNLPMTFYPALIAIMIESAIDKKVFVEGGATNFVKRIEDKIYTERKENDSSSCS